MSVGQAVIDRYFEAGPNQEFVGIHAELPKDMLIGAAGAGAVAVANELLFDVEAIQSVSVATALGLGVIGLVTAGVRHIKNQFGLTISRQESYIGRRGENNE